MLSVEGLWSIVRPCPHPWPSRFWQHGMRTWRDVSKIAKPR